MIKRTPRLFLIVLAVLLAFLGASSQAGAILAGSEASHAFVAEEASINTGGWAGVSGSTTGGGDRASLNAGFSPAFTCEAVTEIPRAECEALLALYDSTNGSSWTSRAGWLATNTPCTWYGITCGGGHVRVLDLEPNLFTGVLTAKLGDLTGLQRLDLATNAIYWDGSCANELTGPIPEELGKLRELEYLDLSCSYLNGAIPPALGGLANLRTLNLSRNELGGGIPTEFSGLASVQVLNLRWNALSGSIPPELGRLANVQDLDLSGNELSGPIPAELGDLSALKSLNLDDNQLGGSIPATLGKLANLDSLHIAWNQLSGEVPDEIGNLSNAAWVVLSSNQLSGSVPPVLGNLASAQWLDLSRNALTGAIPPELGKLEAFDLSYNRLTGVIPLELGALGKLKRFDLTGNQLSGAIPPELGNLADLVGLALDNNQLTGPIPAALGNLKNLHWLLLNNNRLEGEIPTSLVNLSNLESLFVSANPLRGPLPRGLMNLANLRWLYYVDTQLCEPGDPAFQNWLAGIPNRGGTGVICPSFTRITSDAIVADVGRSSGACWGDYDNDGNMDLFVANWDGQDNFLYHNRGDGTFTKVTTGAIVSDGGWSRSCTWGDYDNDGFADLAVSDDGAGVFLYHNEAGASFTRVLDTPIAEDSGACYGISWADYDNDGWLDLFVARHTDANELLYHNMGDGTFEKITTGAIVNDGGASATVSWGDYDGDGCVDVFVGNVNDQRNSLYHNNCHAGFDKITTGPFATDRGFSTTSNWVDYDNDGDLDLFVGNWYADNFLYRNDGRGGFTKITTGVIVTDGDLHDSSWADYDNDGDMDLFGGTHDGVRRFYENLGDGVFVRITSGVIVENHGTSGPNWADYDNDGDVDLFVAAGGPAGTNFLYRNDGSGRHWLQLELTGAAPQKVRSYAGTNRSAIGARVTVTAVIDGREVRQTKEVSGQSGMYNQNGLLLDFGLGDTMLVSSVTIRWPSGAVQMLRNVVVDQRLAVRESLPSPRIYLPLLSASSMPGTLRIAVVLPSAVDDMSLGQSMWAAMRTIEAEMGGAPAVDLKYLQNMYRISDAEAALRYFAGQGADIVIGHGSQYAALIQEIAPDFPRTVFAWGPGAETFGLPNVYAYTAAAEQGGYVNGLMAARLTRTKTIGVCGPVEVGDVKKYVDGFQQGAASVDPNTKVNRTWTGSYSDVALMNEAARTHIAAGADVLTGASPSAVGAIAAAREAGGVLWFGTQQDQAPVAPELVVASQQYDWTGVLHRIIENRRNGKLGGETFTLTLKDGGLKIAFNPGFALPPDVKAAAEEAIEQIRNGSIIVQADPD